MKLAIFGATSAIAQEVAKNFAADHADMVLVGRDETALKTIVADLKVRGAEHVEYLVADLAALDTLPALVQKAIDTLSTLDVALIAHGTLPVQAEVQSNIPAIIAEMNTNALSYMSLMSTLADYMEGRRRGCIAVISSVAGDRGRSSNYVYGAAKAAVSTFTSGLRGRLGRAGVSVVTIKPGFVDTPMTAGVAKKGPLFAKPDVVGKRIYVAMLKGEDVVYVPWFWSPIMGIIHVVPERIFKKLKF